MEYLRLINNSRWDVFLAIFIISAIIYALVGISRENVGKMGIWGHYSVAILISIVIVLIILLGLTFKPDSTIFDKLSQGEVIVGLAVVAPTLITWYNADKEKKEKIIKEDFSNWLDDFYTKNDNSINHMQAFRLETILKKDEYLKILDYCELFMIIQNELKLPGNKNLFKWTIINKDILDTIKEIKKQDLKDVLSKMLFIDNMYTLKFVDFNIYNFSDLFDIPCKKEKEIHYEFQNCILTKEIFEIIEKNNSVIFELTDCIIDMEPYNTRENIRKLKKNGNIIIDSYYNNLGESKIYYNYYDSEESQSRGDFHYYDVKNIGLEYQIDSYLYEKKEFRIKINNQNNTSIENLILNALSETLKELNDKKLKLTKENCTLSRSKSYVPDNIIEKENYEWYSWNILKREKINLNKKFFVFAIQINSDNNTKKFSCLIFEKEKFRELYQFKEFFDNEIYHLNFAKYK